MKAGGKIEALHQSLQNIEEWQHALCSAAAGSRVWMLIAFVFRLTGGEPTPIARTMFASAGVLLFTALVRISLRITVHRLHNQLLVTKDE